MSTRETLSDRDRWLAAEYAVGVLAGRQREEARSRLESDPSFAREVAAWQAQLAPMLDEVEAVSPSSAVWPQIQNRLFSEQSTASTTAGAGMWKLITGISSAAALASLALLFAVTGGDFTGERLKSTQHQVAELQAKLETDTKALQTAQAEVSELSQLLEQAQGNLESSEQVIASAQSALETANQELAALRRQVQEARPLVASLTQSGDVPAFVAQYDPLKKALLIRTAISDEDEKVPEVWLIPADGERKGSVLSMGVMNEDAPDELQVSEDLLSSISEGGTLAITMEPPGGAPNGVATGPVIALGTLQSF